MHHGLLALAGRRAPIERVTNVRRGDVVHGELAQHRGGVVPEALLPSFQLFRPSPRISATTRSKASEQVSRTAIASTSGSSPR